MKKPLEAYICDGCLNLSKRNSPCRHSFCDGNVIKVVEEPQSIEKIVSELNWAFTRGPYVTRDYLRIRLKKAIDDYQETSNE